MKLDTYGSFSRGPFLLIIGRDGSSYTFSPETLSEIAELAKFLLRPFKFLSVPV
jgi:hypothetical protein